VEFDLVHAIRTVFSYMEDIFEQKKVHFQLKVAGSPFEPSIVSDQRRIMQIFIELIGNAIKFTYKGVIMLTLKQVSDSLILVKLKDDGIGMESEILQKLLYPDSKKEILESENSQTKQHGVGIGIEVSK
jgi:signal transduction histidine kinase